MRTRRAAWAGLFVVACLLIAAQQASAAIIPPTVAHWSFDSTINGVDGSGNPIACTNSGNDTSANTLAISSSFTDSTGTATPPFGGGFLYTGEDYNYVELPSTITLSATTGYTISLWYRQFRSVNNQDAIPIGDQTNTQNFLAFDSAYNGLRVRMSNTSDNFTFSPTEDAGVWHQCVVSVDPTTGVTVYKDGALIGTVAGKANMTINAIGFGYSSLTQSAPALMDWYGEIDEVWLFGGPVTTTQVTNLYTYNSLTAPGTTPEPATLALLGLGAALTLRRRRRQR